MKLIYIAGPYTSDPASNTRAAQSHAQPLVGHAMPVVPHCLNLDGGTHEFWYAGTLALMLRCDAVLAMPTWTQSPGALREVRAADRAKIPVFYEHAELLRWIGGHAVGTLHGERGPLEKLLAGLPQTVLLRCGSRVEEVRAWREEADDGLIYEAKTMGRIRLESAQGAVFEEVEDRVPEAVEDSKTEKRITGASIFAEMVNDLGPIEVLSEVQKIAAKPGPYQRDAQIVLEQGRRRSQFEFKTSPPTPLLSDLNTALETVEEEKTLKRVLPAKVEEVEFTIGFAPPAKKP